MRRPASRSRAPPADVVAVKGARCVVRRTPPLLPVPPQARSTEDGQRPPRIQQTWKIERNPRSWSSSSCSSSGWSCQQSSPGSLAASSDNVATGAVGLLEGGCEPAMMLWPWAQSDYSVAIAWAHWPDARRAGDRRGRRSRADREVRRSAARTGSHQLIDAWSYGARSPGSARRPSRRARSRIAMRPLRGAPFAAPDAGHAQRARKQPISPCARQPKGRACSRSPSAAMKMARATGIDEAEQHVDLRAAPP